MRGGTKETAIRPNAAVDENAFLGRWILFNFASLAVSASWFVSHGNVGTTLAVLLLSLGGLSRKGGPWALVGGAVALPWIVRFVGDALAWNPDLGFDVVAATWTGSGIALALVARRWFRGRAILLMGLLGPVMVAVHTLGR